MTTETSFTVPVGGGNLTAWQWGDPTSGPSPALALHGITAHGRSFRTVATRLSADHGRAVLAPDLRGRGRSRDVSGPFGMKAHADDCARILDAAGVERATLVGHSMGGFVALVAAHRHPDRVDRIVLVDGGLPLALPDAVLSLPPDELVGAVIGPALASLRMTFSSVEEHRAMWQQHWALQDHWNAAIEAYVDEDLVGEAPALQRSAREEAVLADGSSELTEDDVERALAGLAHPTVLLAAEQGLVGPDPLYADDQLAHAPSDIDVRRVAGVNHYTIAFTDAGCEAIAAAVRG